MFFPFIYFWFSGNQTTNKTLKEQLKKKKKVNKRSERKVNDVADVLENFTLDMGGEEDYDFKVDFDWFRFVFFFLFLC